MRHLFNFAILTLILVAPATADDAFGPNPTWKAPEASAVRQQAIDWLEASGAKAVVRDAAMAGWPEEAAKLTPDAVLEKLARVLAAGDADAAKLVERCGGPNTAVVTPDVPWLLDEATPPFVRNNLRLYYARWLAHNELYDEALVMLTGLEPDDVVDPASLLFYQAVAQHRLVQAKESRKTARRLLEREDELPRRYAQLGRLMSEDLKELKDDSLDHIARRMDDIRRRLDLGRAGKRVRDIEDGVIASLDKMIEELEEQQKKQQQQQQPGGQQSGKPMQDSRIASQKGPGQVTRRDIGSRSGWGGLPPKEREEALQQIGKDFPGHYRDAIEQYFRRLAREEEGGSGR